MRIVVVAVGRLRDPHVAPLVDDYLGRIRRHVACDLVEVQGDGDKLLRSLERATAGANVVACEVEGKVHASPAFAKGIERLGSRGKGVVAFVIGGADGIPPSVSQAAAERWSLSALTFPHRLARLVLVEQVYRALTILRGEPYAH